MEANFQEIGDVVVVTLPGESLDAGNVKEFKRDIASQLDAYKNVVFDMSQIQFVDSSGLGAILSCLRRLNDLSGDLKLCSMTRTVRALFELVRMHRIFEIHNSCEDAIRSYQ